jgi:hypothetical protein
MNIGGIYTDPYHSPISGGSNIFGFNVPWFGGIRIIGNKNISSSNSNSNSNVKDDNNDDTNENNNNEKFITIGCDDGFNWWVLSGKFTNNKIKNGDIDMDFTPKAPGVGMLKCSYKPGSLSFLDTDDNTGITTVDNIWSRLIATAAKDDSIDDESRLPRLLQVETKHAAFNNINGLFVDLNIYKTGSSSFAGIRVISDRLGKIIRDEICVIGTDDGIVWWYITGGKFINKMNGTFCINNNNSKLLFGTSSTGTCHNGVIKFDDDDDNNGSSTVVWTKMTLNKTDIHSLPKETTD